MNSKRFIDVETLFYDTLGKVKTEIDNKDMANIDVIIGIPFFNEQNTLVEVVKIAQQSLKSKDIKKLIVCVGDPAGKKALENLKNKFKDEFIGFLMPSGVNGRGYSIRAIFELARHFKTDVVLLEADLQNKDEQGILPSWVDRLLEPVLNKYDMSVANFRRHPFEDVAGNLFVSPLISALYGTKFNDPLSGVFGIAHNLVEDFCNEFDKSEEVGGYGINPWLITTALKWNKRICEVNLGAKLSPISFGKKNIVFKEMTRTLFECINRDEEFWLRGEIVEKTPDNFGRSKDVPLKVICSCTEFFESFKEGFYHYKGLLNSILSKDIMIQLENLANSEEDNFSFDRKLWVKIVYEVLIAYSFYTDIEKEDLLEGFMAIYDGLIASFLMKISKLEEALSSNDFDIEEVVSANCHFIFKQFQSDFIGNKDMLLQQWVQKTTESRPVITPLDYLEFIPGVPIVLPKKIKGHKNKEIKTGAIFKRLQKKYEDAFEQFLDTLGVDSSASPKEIIERVEGFMQDLEATIDFICPGDLSTEEGTLNVIRSLFKIFPHKKVYAVKWEVLQKLLYEYPPANLVVRLGYRNMWQLFENMDVREILTLAHFTEDKNYFDRIFYWLRDNLRPDSFEEVELMPMVVSRSKFPALTEMRQISDLNRLTARVVVTNIGKGMGGKYPKLRYFTRIAKSIVEAENFSIVWKAYAKERKEVGRKFVNSLSGHYGKALFSAHHIFENWHHRKFAHRLEELAEQLKYENKVRESKNISIMAEGYGLSMMLEDGTFLPCSAWTWASFSFKGGEGIPTPLFLHVERDWFNHDLLEEIYKEMGYNAETIMEQVFQLISQGRESSDLTKILLDVDPPKEEVVIQQLEIWPEAKKLKRYDKNPILEPIKSHYWESRFVLNTAAVRIEGKIYLLYRALGDDEISRIGLAVADGYNIIERLDTPIFEPEIEEEKWGCEDPRVVIIEDELFMLYTAYDGVVAQIAAASISVDDFLNKRFDKWQRRGLAFPGLWDKDAILFPEKIDGKYVIYHRIEPSIWIAYADKITFPWPNVGHKIILGPRSGKMWDSMKIGAGAQPIKTKYGWLLIYHGVDMEMFYRLGVLLVDLNDPGRLLYRSPNPVLSPETECEIGKKGCWVPNVVFTCGAVPAKDKDILDIDDEILVYYGAADTNICLATGTVGELIPEEVRKRVKKYNL